MKGFIEVPVKRGSVADDALINVSTIAIVRPTNEDNVTHIYFTDSNFVGQVILLPYEKVRSLMAEALK